MTFIIPPRMVEFDEKTSKLNFNQIFLFFQTNKKLINLIETRSSRLVGGDCDLESTKPSKPEQLIEDEFSRSSRNKKHKSKKDYLAKFDPDDDISANKSSSSVGLVRKHASSSSSKRLDQEEEEEEEAKNLKSVRKKKSKSNHQLTSKKENLIEMVRDLASFNWPDITQQQQQNQAKQDESLTPPPEMISISTSRVTTTKQIKFETEVTTTQQPTTINGKYVSKSRSPSCARSYSGGLESNRFRSESRGAAGPVATVRSNTTSFMSSRAASTSTAASRSSSRSGSVRIVNILGKEIVRLPSTLEREIKIKKEFDPLGIVKVDCSVDEGMNGCCVLKIEPNSACARDGRLKSGDYLLSVNNEQMRHLSNSSARAILTRASLISNDVM